MSEANFLLRSRSSICRCANRASPRAVVRDRLYLDDSTEAIRLTGEGKIAVVVDLSSVHGETHSLNKSYSGREKHSVVPNPSPRGVPAGGAPPDCMIHRCPDDPSTRLGIHRKASPRERSIDRVPDDYLAIHPAHIKNPAGTRVLWDCKTL